MHLSAKIIYAFKAVTDLSLQYGEAGPVKVADIAERQDIPKKFLIQILIQLKNAGIVNSSRGAAGGYYLLKSPENISLVDVIKAVDENVFFDVSTERKSKKSDLTAILYGIWAEINVKVERDVKEVTFDKVMSKLNNDAIMYHI